MDFDRMADRQDTSILQDSIVLLFVSDNTLKISFKNFE
jgi:hypothetical protein